jgi:Ca-activated chloride channel family protein
MKQTPTIEVLTERPLLAAGGEQTVDVLIRITPPERPDPVNGNSRPPLNLSLVLDRSGSMEGEKIIRAREAALYCVDQLLPSDRLSVVTFDDQIEVLVPSQTVSNRAGIRELITGISTRGSTALHQAWVRGGIQVSEHLEPAAINRVLLVTDGLANVGETRTDTIVGQACGLAAKGVTTSTIGIGRDFNEDLLIPMGTAGGGNSWHVAEPRDMERIFRTEMEGLIAQIGHTVTLELMPGDGATVVDLLNDFEKTSGVHFKLPNLIAGSPLEIVARLKVPARRSGERLRAIDVRLAWEPQATPGERAELIHEMTVEFGDKEKRDASPADERVKKAVTLLMAARAHREAVDLLDRGDILAARSAVASSLAMLEDAAADGDSHAVMFCERLESVAAGLEGPDADVEMSRKKLSYQSHDLRNSRKLK